MLQALELVNGEKLTHWLMRGSKKLLGQLPPEPAAVFDSGTMRMPSASDDPAPIPFDIDISKAGKLWLIVQDVDSYEPEKVEAVWAQTELVGPDEAVTKLSALHPMDASGLRASGAPLDYQGARGDAVRVNTPSRVVYDISGKGFTRLRGGVVLERRSFRSDIQPKIRFFVFEDEPNMERLVTVAPDAPVPGPPQLKTSSEMVDHIFWYTLERAPSARERRTAENALRDPAHPTQPSAGGLADLLWAVLMTPEFQLIR
jgi:hypothetical protein